MNTRLILVVIVIILAHLATAILFLSCNNKARKQHRNKVSDMKSQFDLETETRTNQHKDILASKYGVDKLDRIALDPRLNIKLTLEKLFERVLPGHWKIKVTVDRFTEFRVFIEANILKQPEELSGYLKQVFSRISADYVYEVVFSKGKDAYIIDKKDLQKIDDWEEASIQKIERHCFR